MNKTIHKIGLLLALAAFSAGLAWAQTAPAPYQPKFANDPARSEAEAQALGYIRVIWRAQRDYKKRHNQYADSLMTLAGTGSVTKRMAKTTQRGDYKVSFHARKDGYVLAMAPGQIGPDRRAFYADEDGIHADEQKPADASSPLVK